MVMHARKPQRLNDGYFEKHQTHPYQGSKYSSKRDYEREASSRSTNYIRDRDNSPNAGAPTSALNNGNSSYRSDSNELDSPRDSRDRYQSSSYIQKMKDRSRGDYKKDKYSIDKRDRRDRDAEHRTNHDRLDMSQRRSSKVCNLPDKRSRSRDRDRMERDGRDGRDARDGREVRDVRDARDGRDGRDVREGRDNRDLRDGRDGRDLRDVRDNRDARDGRDCRDGRDARDNRDIRDNRDGRDARERDRLNRFGDWSEHVSSSGKKYYYNCKTEVSQWEKPKDWLDKERNMSKDQHRDYRDKERDRDREDRFSRSSYAKHSSSRGGSRLRWPHESEGLQGHRRRNDADSQDMDISPGDSTPTSEASYSHSSTPTTQQPQQSQSQQPNPDGPVLLANVLPRLASHPSTPTSSQLHFTTPSSASGSLNASTCTVSSSGSGNNNMHLGSHQSSGGSCATSKLASIKSASDYSNSMHTPNLSQSSPTTMANAGNGGHMSGGPLGSNHSSMSGVQQTIPAELMMNSNAPGPPTPVTLANLPKILSQITGNKQIDQSELQNPQKALQTINNALLMTSRQHSGSNSGGTGSGAGSSCTDRDAVNQIGNNSNSNSLREHAVNSPLYNLPHNIPQHSMLNHSNMIGGGSQYVQATSGGMISTQSTGGLGAMGISSQFSAAGLKADGSSSLLVGDGPPTPTQELDMTGDHRKLDGTSASLSSLQGVVTSSQVLRSQGPSLTPSLANYFRADLIAHVTNWPSEILEKQAQIASDEANIIGDLQCTKVSADLKSARSVVRITEITATLQEQKVMYLRQQIRRLEELKSQNSFMSDDL